MGIGYDNDEYPFEGHIIKDQPPPFIGDDGYVLKNQRVVQYVRPVVTRHVYVNGKPVKEERVVGDYQPYSYYGHNTDTALRESLDNLGDINGFLSQVQMEASMPPRDGAAAFHSRRPAAAAAAENKPNWGSRAAWVAAPGDGSFSGYTQYPDQTQDHYYHPSSGLTDQNWGNYNSTWPNKRQASPSRSGVYPRQSLVDSNPKSNNELFKDNSPTGYGERYEAQILYRSELESNKPNWGSRPNWPRNASPPGSPVHSKQEGIKKSDSIKPNRVFQDKSPTRYGDSFKPSHLTQHFEGKDQRQDNPPLKQHDRLDMKENNNQESSPKENMMDAYMIRSGSTEVVKNENIEAQNLHHSDLESNKPKWGARPNWPNSHRASPPGSPMHSKQGIINSDGTKPNRDFQDNSSTRYGNCFEPSSPTHLFEGEHQRQDSPPLKQLERLDIKDNSSQESSPRKNIMDAYMARSGSTEVTKNGNIEAQNLYNPDSESNKPKWGARPNWPNSRRASPPGSPVHPKQGTINSDITKPNRGFQDDSPSRYADSFEPSRPTHHFEGEDQRQQYSPPLKQPDRMDIKDKNSQESSPHQNTIDVYMARSRSSEVVKNGNTDSLVKDNALQVKESDNSPNWPNKKSRDEETPTSYEREGKKMEKGENDIKKQMGNLDHSSYSAKESSSDPISHTTKPKLYGGWYKPSKGMQGVSSSSTPTTKHWSEITPNPPVRLTKHSVIESDEAIRAYAYVKPKMGTGYYGAITSEDAVKKYGGFFVPPS